MTKLRIVLPILTIVAYSLATCEKASNSEPEKEPEIVYGNGNPEVGECLIIGQYGDSAGEPNIFYNKENRIAKIGSKINFHAFEYFDDKRLSEQRICENGEYSWRYLFEWTNGSCIEYTYVYDDGWKKTSKRVLELNQNGEVVKEYFVDMDNDQFNSYALHEWVDGNLIKTENWTVPETNKKSNCSTEFELSRTTYYEYDDAINPIQKLAFAGYFSNGRYQASKNNLILYKEYYKNDLYREIEIKYEYNERRFPTSIDGVEKIYFLGISNNYFKQKWAYNCNYKSALPGAFKYLKSKF